MDDLINNYFFIAQAVSNQMSNWWIGIMWLQQEPHDGKCYSGIITSSPQNQ